MDIINDFLRIVLFGLSQGLLYIFDMVWDIIKRVVTLDLSTELGKWFALIIGLVVLFIILRLFKIMMKTMFDEEYRAKLNVIQLIIKLTLASFSIGAIPIGFSYLNEISIDFIEHMEYFVPNYSMDINSMRPSDVILQSGRINTDRANADLGPEIKITENFDINAKTSIKDEHGNSIEAYKYFPNYSSLFILLATSVFATGFFCLIALSIAQRIFIIAYKYVLAPYPISGLIDHEDKAFATWMKMLLGDYMMNFAQLYGMYLTLFVCNNANFQNMLGSDAIGIFAKILLLISGILAVNNIPTYISTLIGGHGSGALQSLQELKTIGATTMALAGMGASATVGIGLGAIGGAIGGAINGYAQSRQKHPTSSVARAGGRALAGAIGGAIGGGAGAMKSSLSPQGSYFSGVSTGYNKAKGGGLQALNQYKEHKKGSSEHGSSFKTGENLYINKFMSRFSKENIEEPTPPSGNEKPINKK